MESLEQNCCNNSLTICTNILIFGKDTYLVLISRMISTHPISSQILIFVTSNFATLYASFVYCTNSARAIGQNQSRDFDSSVDITTT